MKYFFDGTIEDEDFFDLETTVIEGQTNNPEYEDLIYVEKYLTIHGSKFRYNIVPTGEDTALLFLCFDAEMFDPVTNELSNKNNVELMTKAWPLLMTLLSNGIDDDHSKGALVKFPDLIDGGHIWVIGTNLENLDFEDLDNKYVIKKFMTLLELAGDLLTEISENEISGFDAFMSGIKEGLNIYNKVSSVIDLINIFR